jgi:nucleoside-diphosphate-sugar epimerase/gluconate kinase
MLIILFGLSGSGKKHVGEILSYDIGAKFFAASEYYPQGMVDAIRREEPVTTAMCDIYHQRLIKGIRLLLAHNKHVVIAQDAYTNMERLKILEFFSATCFIWVSAAQEILLGRLRRLHLDTNYHANLRNSFEPPDHMYYQIDNSLENNPEHLRTQFHFITDVSNMIYANTVIVTGAGGFIGGHMVCYLLERRYKVIALLHQGPDAMLQKHELHARMSNTAYAKTIFLEGDITIADDVDYLLKFKPSFIIHCAAILSFKYDTNDVESFGLGLELMQKVNCAQLLADKIAAYQASSSCQVVFLSHIMQIDYMFMQVNAYETPIQLFQHQPRNFYEETKYQGELYWRDKILNLTTIYVDASYGTYQFSDTMLTNIIRKKLLNTVGILNLPHHFNPIYINNLVKFIFIVCDKSLLGDFILNGDGNISFSSICRYFQVDYCVVANPLNVDQVIDDSRACNIYKQYFAGDLHHKPLFRVLLSSMSQCIAEHDETINARAAL